MGTAKRTTRELVYEGLIGCISKYGIEEASVTRIAKTSGITRSLVSYYFPKKDQLFLEAIKYIAVQFQNSATQPVETTAKPISRLLERISKNLVYFLNNESYFHCFNLFYYYAGIRNEYAQFNSEISFIARREMRNDLEQAAKEEKRELDNPAETILIIHDVLVRTIQRYKVEKQVLSQSAYIEESMHFFRRWLPKLIREQSKPKN